MYISKNASRIRQLEAQKARDNRAEIVKALSHGQITRRDLYKWGIFTVAGGLALKNGLSPFARSAYADVPTGTPRSPLFGAAKFTQPMPRLALQTPIPLTRDAATGNALFPAATGERPAKRLSYHTDFTANLPTRNSAIRSPGAARSKDVRPARSSRISDGTSSSPKPATLCRWRRSRRTRGSIRISRRRIRPASGPMAEDRPRAGHCRRS